MLGWIPAIGQILHTLQTPSVLFEKAFWQNIVSIQICILILAIVSCTITQLHTCLKDILISVFVLPSHPYPYITPMCTHRRGFKMFQGKLYFQSYLHNPYFSHRGFLAVWETLYLNYVSMYVTGQAVEKCTVVENFIWVLA